MLLFPDTLGESSAIHLMLAWSEVGFWSVIWINLYLKLALTGIKQRKWKVLSLVNGHHDITAASWVFILSYEVCQTRCSLLLNGKCHHLEKMYVSPLVQEWKKSQSKANVFFSVVAIMCHLFKLLQHLHLCNLRISDLYWFIIEIVIKWCCISGQKIKQTMSLVFSSILVWV